MNSNRSTPNAGEAANPGKPSASRGNCYVASAPLPDVMFDQLEYLLAHSDCGRLHQVKNWLLLPFHTAPKAKSVSCE